MTRTTLSRILVRWAGPPRAGTFSKNEITQFEYDGEHNLLTILLPPLQDGTQLFQTWHCDAENLLEWSEGIYQDRWSYNFTPEFKLETVPAPPTNDDPSEPDFRVRLFRS